MQPYAKKETQTTKQYISAQSSRQASLLLSATQPKQDGNFTVFIKLQKNSHTPHLSQIELGYDPQVIQAIQIYQGDIFINPDILLKNINNNTGRVSIVLSCPSQKTEKNCINNEREILSAVQFRQVGYARRLSEIQLLPKTVLFTKNNEEIPLQKNNTMIQLQTAAPQTASQAAY